MKSEEKEPVVEGRMFGMKKEEKKSDSANRNSLNLIKSTRMETG